MVKHLYLHIPYCNSKCDYCDFYSVPCNGTVREDYVAAVVDEITERYNGEPLETVFFGGGTPSLLTGQQVNNILSKLKLTKQCEVSIECNPETITAQKMKEFVSAGINRLSVGVQSFEDLKLIDIGRERSCNVPEKLSIAGKYFSNIGIDLMYSLPGQTKEDIIKEISNITENIKHVSYYSLTIEEDTPLANKYDEHPIDDDNQSKLAEEVVSKLRDKEFARYEISNYSKSEYECKHNQAYWSYQDYLGVGAGAVSTIKGIRIENIKNIEEYLSGKRVVNTDNLSEKEQKMEKIMMGLRTTTGVAYEKLFDDVLRKYPELIIMGKAFVHLTNKGFLVYNSILEELDL